jgi:hypothetical protein
MWYRVFASNPDEPNPVRMVEYLHSLGHSFTPHFTGDDLGWTTARLDFAYGTPLAVNRYLTKADDLRNDLNAYAAELETQEDKPNSVVLMEKVIQTQQLFTFENTGGQLEAICDDLARWLANQTAGIVQIDGRGWLDSQGDLLLREVL